MAMLLPNPDNVPSEVLTGYQAQNNLIYAGNAGFLNINMSPEGIVSEGSVFELNGFLAKVETAEPVNGIKNLPAKTVFYVYAMESSLGNEDVGFFAAVDAPEWDTAKGGYYLSNGSRALLRGVTDNNRNISGLMKMNAVLNTSVPPDEGGELVYQKNERLHETVSLEAGWYRFEMASGAGRGNAGVTGSYLTGGQPSERKELSGVFYHPGGNLLVHVGGDGYKGGDGIKNDSYFRHACGGGGSGAGEETYIQPGGAKISTGHVKPGDGGKLESIYGPVLPAGKGILEYNGSGDRPFILGDGEHADDVRERYEDGYVPGGSGQNPGGAGDGSGGGHPSDKSGGGGSG